MTSSATAVQADWAVVADYALIDQSGKLSVIGIFNRLWAPSFPSLHPVAHVVAALTGPANRSFTSELRFWSPTKELVVGGQQLSQIGPDGRAGAIFRLAPLPLPAPGEYIIELLVDGIGTLQIGLNVDQVPQP